MLQTITLPRASESNAIGTWPTQPGKRGLTSEWATIQRDLAATQPLPKSLPSAAMTAYWLTAATHRVPWFRSLRATWPQHIGPRRAGSKR
jgi:hypothetical protein